jgi:hypothetical protein
MNDAAWTITYKNKQNMVLNKLQFEALKCRNVEMYKLVMCRYENVLICPKLKVDSQML